MGITKRRSFVIRKLLAWFGCLVFLGGNPGEPSKSYLKATSSPLTKRVESYRRTKNLPIYSLTQRASHVWTITARGWRVVRVIKGVRTTAYAIGDGHTPGTRTACGVRAQFGVVAVDPRNIRLKSHLYIAGYGFGQALDTGGRIKGKRVDLCFNKVAEAKKHGVKTRDVYILERAD